ncbi:stomatin family protein [Stemphylium lycopersici]|nr:stomatin family protein [Stemphylium lycopersici]
MQARESSQSGTTSTHYKKYYLPAALLEKLENIPGRDPWTGEIHLKDVDANIGHILVHFLYTGVYQTLNDEDIGGVSKSTICKEFQKAALALEAAKKYSVSGLQELAQIELERRGKDMCLREAVCAIREEFMAGSPDECSWLRDYVSQKVRWTFEHDLPTLSAPDFFEIIESPTLSKLLAQTIVGLFSEEVDKLRKAKATNGKTPTLEYSEPPGSYSSHPLTPASEHISATHTAWPASVEKFGAFDDSAAAWDPQNLDHDSVSRTPDLPKLTSEPIFETSTAWPASVEKFGAFDDSAVAWDPHSLCHEPGGKSEVSEPIALPSSIKEEKKNELPHTAEEHADTTADGQEESQHGKVPSLMDQATKPHPTAVDGFTNRREEEETSRFSGIPAGIHPLIDELPASENDVKDKQTSDRSGPIASTKKKLRMRERKMGKKGKRSEAAAKENEDTEPRKPEEGVIEIQDLQAEQAATAQPQEREVASTSSTATKDKTDGIEVQPLWGSWVSPWGVTKKKKSKSSTGWPPQSLVTPPPPAPPPEIQLDVDPTPVIADVATDAANVPGVKDEPNAEVNPYAGLSKSQVRKLKIKVDREQKEEEAMRQKEKEEADGIRRWEQQKEKQARLEEEDAGLLRFEDEEVERLRLEEQATEQARLAEEEKGKAATPAANMIDIGAASADEDCEFRLQHLSESDGWQDCDPCVLYMRRIAFKLHAGGLSTVDPFAPMDPAE